MHFLSSKGRFYAYGMYAEILVYEFWRILRTGVHLEHNLKQFSILVYNELSKIFRDEAYGHMGW